MSDGRQDRQLQLSALYEIKTKKIETKKRLEVREDHPPEVYNFAQGLV